ncbi:hypothetical protein MNV49_007314 [Pseudohyphozyma bogoriensis]|nr:hypothetical protein MNV49_007314 [Pseudohyphozyma bogoriensis]
MPPKAAQQIAGQQSLFSFFKKDPNTPSSSQSSSRPTPSKSLATPPLSTKKQPTASSSSSGSKLKQSSSSASLPNAPSSSATKSKSATTPLGASNSTHAGASSSSRQALTPPITSEADSQAHPSSSNILPSSSSQSVPAKRAAPIADSEDEEEEEQVVTKKRAAASARPTIIDSDDSDDDVKIVDTKKSKSKAKTKSRADDDDFSASGAESEDMFDDGLDDFLDDAEDEVVQKKSKPKAAPKKAAAPSRPPPKPMGKSGSGTSSIKTQAELMKLKEKEKKAANEEVYSFLLDPKDADGIRPGEEGYDPRTLYIPKSAWAQFTPFEKQFWEVKATHYDTVLFFQKGKFYELYEEDASIGHREFDLKLTDRVKMRMVGVPESSFDFWAAKFLAQGYKVGRVDQCETALGAEMRVKDGKASGKKQEKASNGKAIVRRELKSVLTSGTIVDGSMLTDDLSNHCVAIKEYTPTSSSPPTFGICVLDASTAEFSLSYFEDDASRTQIETLIRQLKPKELIHEKANLSVSTLRLLRNCLSIDTQWTALKPGTEFLGGEETKNEVRKLFAKKKGEEEDEDEEMAESEESEEENIPESIRKMYGNEIAMSALGGMIWYLRQLNLDSDLVTTRNFNIYDPIAQGNALVLDGQTLAHIEVLQNSQGGIEGTLLQLLSRCVTPFGKRLFKIWLCAPLREVAAINDRLDAVDDLMANPNFASVFDSMTKKLPDLERMLSRIHAKSCKKQEFLKVVESFDKIASGLEKLAGISEDFSSAGIKTLLRKVPDISTLLDNVREIYDGEELLPVEGKDEGYETVRQAVEDIEASLQACLKKAKKDLDCRDVTFKDIGTKDIYQIQVPAKQKVPNNWTKMSNTKDYNRYYSPESARLVQDLKEARERKTAVVNDFQFKVYGEFDKEYSVWMGVVKLVAELDCLLSLSKSSAALGEPAVRPEIIESDVAFVEFEELRHPCVLSSTTDFIPNDVALGDEAQRMILLTGPNMAGKSTMLRMTCAAIIMAQRTDFLLLSLPLPTLRLLPNSVGCYVPASKARIAPIDAIYSRMGANDFIFANASTFKVEMDDCNKILTKSTPRSLVILDELGRGTSTYDGMAIAFAVLHRLATHVGCIGFFATHFTSLTEDFAYHPQIRLCNMQTQVSDDTRAVIFLYKLVLGSAPKSYGPHVASMAGMPEILVERAIAISKQFETTSRAREREMRANESLPLTSQADAAFLTRFAKMGLSSDMDQRQLLRTLAIIRKSVGAAKKAMPAVEA